MKIVTSYTTLIKEQLQKVSKGKKEPVEYSAHRIDDKLMDATAAVCMDALKLCVEIFLSEWEYLSSITTKKKAGIENRSNVAEHLVHSTDGNKAKYSEFDERFQYLPSGCRRALISKALGIVSSYVSNHENWEKESPTERGAEPTLGLPSRYELAFYGQERDLCDIQKGIIGLKLYDGTKWDWYYFKVDVSDAKYVARMKETRKMLSPVIEKSYGKYQLRFSFEENRTLVSDKMPISYVIMAVDLGINAPASWCIMTADGTVYAKGVIHLPYEEDHLNRLINRKRMYQQEGKKCKYIYRMITDANRALSIETCRRIMLIAELYSVDCIVFEHLERNKKLTKGKKYRERIHMWRCKDVQKRVELQAHQRCMRISRVCAWGTSKYAFDGSGEVIRGKDAGLNTYSLCRFQNGKVYNCDISAAQNIGARYFLREYAKFAECPELPKTPQRTYATLREVVKKFYTAA